MKTIHELKTWPEYFDMVWDGYKNWELRKNDRDYKKLDTVILREWSNDLNEYTGREITATISYILKEAELFGLKDGYCILSLHISNYSE